MADCIRKFAAHAEQVEAEIRAIEADIKQLKSGKLTMQAEDETPQLQALRTENSKLLYQRTHLQRSVAAEEATGQDCMVSVIALLLDIFGQAIRKAFPSLPEAPVMVTPSTKENFGDYQCNNAMNIVQLLKSQGQKMAPRQIAQNIVDNMPQNELIEKVEIAGPGFINIYLRKAFIASQLHDLLKKGVRPPRVGPKKKVIVDMSSPNIAKEMHVGHLRSTIIGDGIARLYDFVGHNVVKLNHLGDWGTQFGMLITHLQQKFPNYLNESPPIGDLQAFYKESKVRFDDEPEFKKVAYEAVVKLQNYEADFVKAWNLICEVSSREFCKIYKRLDIENLVSRGESFYQPLMAGIVKQLDDKGMVEPDEGRKICWAPGMSVPLTVIKSDGGFTYDSSDVTALHHRLFEEKADVVLYVVDQGQAMHLNTCFAVVAAAGWYDPKVTRVEHVGFGVVLGEDK
ncbi:Arginine--tRNA ligase, cytoplasmic [Lamellibrachia satsuma]|nr:Arginine--tRNA ligase, cytoplasmic [Lamellibrachia satsuma]